MDHPGIASALKACMRRGFDFGTAYGRLRPYWYRDEFPSLESQFGRAEKEDREMRESALDNATNRVLDPHILPRRIWDLFGNRVLPWWVVKRNFSTPCEDLVERIWKEIKLNVGLSRRDIPWAVSHSWLDDERRQNIYTTINAYEWPVPIPADTTLDRVRIELLNLGAEYVWLDVLCLRQMCLDPAKEAIREHEWKLDVPTIGSIYHHNMKIVDYFSGLGRPFRLGDMDSERHWLNRAWTLQEASSNAIIGGRTADSPFPPAINGSVSQDREAERFYIALEAMCKHTFGALDVYGALEIMRWRSASHEADKIGGLAYLLGSKVLPAYISNPHDVSGEDAWSRLVETMSSRYWGQLLFLYPAPGNARYTWRPSWQQVKETPLPRIDGPLIFDGVRYDMHDNTYRCDGFLLKSCVVKGFAKWNPRGDGTSPSPRKGQLEVSHDGRTHTFAALAHHDQPIPDGAYVLFGNKGIEDISPLHCKHWVVGRITGSAGEMQKVSVLRLKWGEWSELQDLGIAKEVEVSFI
ncbi:hypothetical protein NM688_g4839 [Phlebia brevispora]|uniref:Uncharacterized protein n=1 Tax=Phlebia brevispora TaxID=194682 RepID=A0ACC1T1R7_9APHY|nr:hypothetical protein NM688_g4839 [Phlebia brevispora]